MLSQQFGEPPRFQPCAYYSKKLSSVEQNYNIRNQELLALEEWRHWLEGANHPFMVITNHMNLQYLHHAKWLNPRQALIMSSIQWNTDQGIRAATLTEPTPLGGLERKIYVPTSQRQSLLGSVHQVPGSGHPGSQRTLSLLQIHYWWPSISRDVIRYICSCSVCAQSKTPCHAPTHSSSSLVTHRLIL